MSTVFEGKNVSATIFRLGVPAMLSQLATLIHDNRFAGEACNLLFIIWRIPILYQ